MGNENSQERTRPGLRGVLADAAIGVAAEAMPVLAQAALDLIRQSGTPRHLETFTLKDAFEFFAQHKARSPLATAGAIVRTPGRAGARIVLLFLDEANKPLVDGPWAAPTASYLARSLDPELASAFGPRNVIVVS
jgi:hypothetical protein